MANTKRTIEVKFDGDAKGLIASSRAARQAVKRSTSGMQRDSSFASKFASARAKLIVAAIGGILAALPVTSAAAATAMVLAFGAGLSAIGFISAAQNEKVKRDFTGLKEHVAKEMRGISKPFRSTLRVVASEARQGFNALAPMLRRSFRSMAPALSGFTRQLRQALTGPGMRKGLEDMSTAFRDVLRQLGPELGPAFDEMGAQLSKLAKTVSENADIFAELIVFGLRAVSVILNIVNTLATFYAALRRNPLKGLANLWLSYLDSIVTGAAAAFGWIPGLGPKLRKAAAGFHDFATEARKGLTSVPTEVKIKGDIRDLQSKVAAARARLATVPKEKKPKIKAEIADLKAKIASAKSLLASLKDKTVQITTYHNRIYTRPKGFVGPIIGHGRAAGGPVHSGREYLVGERGPEILRMDRGGGGTVVPNRKINEGGGPMQIEGTLDLGGGLRGYVKGIVREDKRNTMRRARAGTGVNA